MDAKRLILTPFIAGVIAAATVFGVNSQVASAEVPSPQVSPYLRAAIKAEAEARGYNYGGDFKFDVMYAGPGMWVSSVQSVGPDGAVVTYGKFASDEIVTTKFVRKGEYGWVNSQSGVGSPDRVPAMAGQPGWKARSWVIEGINFPPNSDVALFDGSALGGETRTPTDHVLTTAKTDATGYFRVTVEFGDYAAKPGQMHRLIQATGGAFLQVAFDQPGGEKPIPTQPSPTNPAPTQPLPTNPAPTDPTRPAPTNPGPESPSVDDGSDGNDALVWGGLVALSLAGLGAAGIVTVSRRR